MKQNRAIATLLCISALSLIAAGCSAPVGDFGRRAPSKWHDEILPEVGKKVARYVRKEKVSDFLLTDDEKQLRRYADGLLEPPGPGWQLMLRVPTEQARTRVIPWHRVPYDYEAYFKAIHEQPYASSDTRYETIISDVNTDLARLDPFFINAGRVATADSARMEATRRTPLLTDEEKQNAIARVDENRTVVEQVCIAVHGRINAYRYALDRLRIEIPSTHAPRVKPAIDTLAQRIARPWSSGARCFAESVMWPNSQSQITPPPAEGKVPHSDSGVTTVFPQGLATTAPILQEPTVVSQPTQPAPVNTNEAHDSVSIK